MASNTQQCVIEREMYLYETESEHGETNGETVDDAVNNDFLNQEIKKILYSKCCIIFCAQ